MISANMCHLHDLNYPQNMPDFSLPFAALLSAIDDFLSNKAKLNSGIQKISNRSVTSVRLPSNERHVVKLRPPNTTNCLLQNKKVLLRERKRHTVCRVARTSYVVLSGGYPILTCPGVPYPRMEGQPHPWVPPS